VPTNGWYQNLLIGIPTDTERYDSSGPIATPLTSAHRVYSIPYVVDLLFQDTQHAVGAGLRMHSPTVEPAGDKIVQLEYVDSLSIGLGGRMPTPSLLQKLGSFLYPSSSSSYVIDPLHTIQSRPTLLSVELTWMARPTSFLTSLYKLQPRPAMASPIVRGSPYTTMVYQPGVVPVLSTKTMPAGVAAEGKISITVDDKSDLNQTLVCYDSKSSPSSPPKVTITNTATLTFPVSDSTYILYVSRPLEFSCMYTNPEPTAPPPPGVVTETATNAVFELFASEPLQHETVLRVALLNNCTLGTNPKTCDAGLPNDIADVANHRRILDGHKDLYPTNAAAVEYTFPTMTQFDDTSEDVVVHFKWGAKSMATGESAVDSGDGTDLLMYALPHHASVLESTAPNGNTGLCFHATMHGKACLVIGNEWAMRETIKEDVSFDAARLPSLDMIEPLVDALKQDINYRLPENYQRAAGDTYFSGKMVAKLGRILTTTRTLKDLAGEKTNVDPITSDDDIIRRAVVKECKRLQSSMPTDDEVNSALDHLRETTQVWLNGTAAAPFVYDQKWGGMVSCGCLYSSTSGLCENTIGDACPGLTDPGNNFGHGFYNDHHFHNGYHVYAAAVVASFDGDFGRRYFEPVLSLIRDIANPSPDDKFFPMFRHKDWFLGSSWASGIGLINGGPYPNGRNQESSSEAIAAYEAIALYGKTMYAQFSGAAEKDNKNAATAASVRDMGRLLLATELRSADTYWHVRKRDSAKYPRIYPKEYTPLVVGMLWSTMAQFQTWFGSDAFLAYGIQLMPLTVASEKRDELDWVREMLPSFEDSCAASQVCDDQAWSVLKDALRATAGDKKGALESTLKISDEAFVSAGGNGHSLSNSIWYISTRPDVEFVEFNSTDATGDERGGGEEEDTAQGKCRACTHDECRDDAFSRCPSGAPFVCVAGPSLGGCSRTPWVLGGAVCDDCCEMHAGC
jgi:endo-1,3(4)-beta-glucanase